MKVALVRLRINIYSVNLKGRDNLEGSDIKMDLREME
jgi:hypothetical protein